MEPVVNTEKLEAEAAIWLIHGESPGFTAQDRAAFQEWLATSPRHRAVYMRLRTGWGRADQFRRLRPFDGAVDEDLLTKSILPSLHGAHERPRTSKILLGRAKKCAYVAIAALLILGLLLGGRDALDRLRGRAYVTEVGGFERVVLSDGSVVHMNTDSRIRVHYTPSRREVRLERGEALFTVAKNPTRPFDVGVGRTVIRAAGTIFAVRLRENNALEVLVTEGRVTVDSPQREARLVREKPASSLSAGDTVLVRADKIKVARTSAAEIARRTAWMSGQLLFEQQTLAEMVAEFNRYNHHQLVIADPSIAGLRMSAGFDATDTRSFIAALERSYGVRASDSQAHGKHSNVIRLIGPDGPPD